MTTPSTAGSPHAEEWTVGRLLEWTTGWLRGREADSPRLDAEVLLASVLGCQRIELYTRFDEVVADEPRAAFRELVKRRGHGEPVAYLTGTKEFFSLSFRVTRDVLVPRPETESLVVRSLDLCRGLAGARIVDVGTGSGAIAVVLARHLPGASITAIDISPQAVAVARENVEAHGVADRVRVLEGDLLSGLPEEATFDLIVSNPPYIREDEFAGLPRDVRDFEPRGALVAGPRGVEPLERLGG
ncbi:MAG: peptide chain release factor N(5)-glutamine methyltransferase, partial [Planctomycetota bacterium]|nr:peptide chain release factor N(5)-glutamine methyltransferase [Planctomycetota bacterium]